MKTINLGNGAECKMDGDGSKYWRLNGKFHRTDGPAVEKPDSSKSWWLNGERHRTDGPALIDIHGRKFWYINGKEYSEEEFEMIKQMLWAI